MGWFRWSVHILGTSKKKKSLNKESVHKYILIKRGRTISFFKNNSLFYPGL